MTAWTNTNKINLYARGDAFATTYLTALKDAADPAIFKISGIEINQSVYSNSAIFSDKNYGFTQEFTFDETYLRAETYAPAILGFKFFAKLQKGSTYSSKYNYYLSRLDSDSGRWTEVAASQSSVSMRPSTSNEFTQWITIKFPFVEFDPDWINQKFRLQVQAKLENGDTGSVIKEIYYQSPNPLTIGEALLIDGVNPFISNTTSSIAFRLLTASADSGTDFLNNKYRSALIKQKAENVLSSASSSMWMSKPNPSKFAVENLYFDLTNNNQPVTIDSVFLDPLTPGMNFHVYYSTDSNGPGTNDASWENLMWTPVLKTFEANKRGNYLLPKSIIAKYIKIEFSKLQAKWYAPGEFEKPVLYKKFPQWVFDYFIAKYKFDRNQIYDPFINDQVVLEHDLLDLAFNYYNGDIIDVDGVEIPINQSNDPKSKELLINLLNTNYNELENENVLDIETLQKIKIAFSKFSTHPVVSANTNTTIGALAQQNAYSTLGAGLINGRIAPAENYPTEIQNPAIADTREVSSLDREPLLFEKSISPMFFYITCRHGYREAYAKFKNDKAYFAGVKRIGFQKMNHLAIGDEDLYSYEINKYNASVEHNDFIVSVDGKSWQAK